MGPVEYFSSESSPFPLKVKNYGLFQEIYEWDPPPARDFSALLPKALALLDKALHPSFDPNFKHYRNRIASDVCHALLISETEHEAFSSLPACKRASDWLLHWDRANTGRGTGSSYYEGNIKTCADKGMRLPTIYETTMTYESWMGGWLPTGDGLGSVPTWAGSTNGVPSHTSSTSWTWTASAYPDFTFIYWIWSGTDGDIDRSYTNSYSVRCVLP